MDLNVTVDDVPAEEYDGFIDKLLT